MTATTTKISRDEPVHFRVRGLEPDPLSPVFSAPGERLLGVEWLNHAAAPPSIPVSPDELATYGDAIREAIASGAVYWVDWSYHDVPEFPPTVKDATIARLLNALQDRQLVPSEGE